IHNDDGVWLRLNDETIKKYVPNMNGYTEAWCLSFNQHLGKSLLVPVDNVFNASQGVRDLDFFSWTSKALPPKESRSNADDFFKDLSSHCPQEAVMQEQDLPFLRGGPGVYKVVKTGPSGHNIRSCPNLRGIPIGMLVLGNKVKAVGEVTNSEGTWVQMDKNSMVEFCESDEGEAWSLARDRGGNQYLRHEDEQVLLDQNVQTPPPSPFSIQAFSKGTSCSNGQGFDYGLGNNK
ncbi:PREDICTED: E3 ubiquitin-protein ligase MYCBP2-like, partial [Acanthisitta chloris]|uniref:E3 ubiquitin-protein ligase MYCBP2-like n=1 Tax=Acanthisitta chloris TaxID=57068 RepID=UPI0004F0F763